MKRGLLGKCDGDDDDDGLLFIENEIGPLCEMSASLPQLELEASETEALYFFFNERYHALNFVLASISLAMNEREVVFLSCSSILRTLEVTPALG